MRKIFSAPSDSFWELGARSAVWGVNDCHGVCVRRAEDHHGQKYWRVFLSLSGDHDPAQTHPLADKVVGLLYNQQFATRREAVCAVEAALLSLQA